MYNVIKEYVSRKNAVTKHRGFTQEIKNTVNKNKAHFRLQSLGLTPNFIAVKGFTLIELLVVVLIIGILAAVALPQYNKAVKKAQGREVLVALDAMDTALTNYYLEHGTYKDITVDKLGVTLPELKYFRYNVGSSCSDSMQETTVTDSLFSWNVNQSPSHFHMWLCGPVGVTVIWARGKLSDAFCPYGEDGKCKKYFGNCTYGGGGCYFNLHNL